MRLSSKIYIAGHTGMVGSAIVRDLKELGYTNIVVRTSAELDLRNRKDVEEFFEKESPEFVFMAAAKVGGIVANNNLRAEFLYDNLAIAGNVIHAAHLFDVTKLLFLGSSCVYPKNSPQPICEDQLLQGELEKTNEPYAIAKIAGIKMCESYRSQYNSNFISVMPCNLYGPNDNYNLETSHVLPALIRKFHEAKVNGDEYVSIWGTGNPKREFLYVDDLARACVFLMESYNELEPINVGCGKEISISELAIKIKDLVGFEGQVKYDHRKPDGTLRKVLDVTKLTEFGWSHSISLDDGLKRTYKDFLSNIYNQQ
ncbi:MAG: GDP-L-fucose synthase [Flavobacteriales bacterium]|nr:GDP-L-fucose synthase [Flavobacteriales bacterium]